MNFLIISRMKDMFFMLPTEKREQIMEGLVAFINKYRKIGTCKDIYSIPSIKGSVSVWETDSAEKGASLFLENPAMPFQDYEMFVLSDFDAYIKAQEVMYEKLLEKS